mmetsp:Transcript_17389/g.69874  ORF Transcript_17389/g.69874 Transcript_17389/m.69874 type:complete len:587 (+) Transcript_17389:711-2471(+)
MTERASHHPVAARSRRRDAFVRGRRDPGLRWCAVLFAMYGIIFVCAREKMKKHTLHSCCIHPCVSSAKGRGEGMRNGRREARRKDAGQTNRQTDMGECAVFLFRFVPLAAHHDDSLGARDGVHGGRDVLDVVLGEASDGDAPVERAVHVELGAQALDLVFREAREGEHADLVGDVRPVFGRALGLEARFEERAHGFDARRHAGALLRPLRAERGVFEDGRDDLGAVHRRRRVHRSDEDLELRFQSARLGGVGAHGRERADAFAVEAEVFGVRLREHDGVAVGDEGAERSRVGLGVARGEALVGAVEEDLHARPLLERCRDGGPLGGRRIDARRVVRARVEHDRRAVLDVGRHILEQPVDVERRLCRGVEVAVPLHLEAGILGDLRVVPPRRLGHVDDRLGRLGAADRREPRDQSRREPARARARKRLHGGDPAFAQRLAVVAVGELERLVEELGEARDGRVLVVGDLGHDALLGLANRRQHVRLARVVAVRAHAEQHLGRRRVVLERLRQPDDRVRRGGLDARPRRHGGLRAAARAVARRAPHDRRRQGDHAAAHSEEAARRRPAAFLAPALPTEASSSRGNCACG